MSTTIDQRVVEMRFDNKNFESNVSTTLSTLDKLKKSLHLDGATKGLESIGSAAKRVDMSGIGSAVQTVQAKFSSLEVIAVTALANITNSAINAGKNIVSALTIDPIISGFQEYETQINAVQTILANTSHQGTTLDEVNAALDELNTYADKTIYNFTEMTRNIGTFTAAGLDLQTSTEAIKGIANLAAMSGSTSVQASTAMYQLSQALASGTVNLQDWNSVVNAGMGGKVFQDALVRTAAAMKGVSEETFRAQNITGTFRESIGSKDGTAWLDAEVLAQTLRQFTGDLSEAELAAMGFTQEQVKNIQTMAQTANEAATKVKTLSQLWDTLKEAAGSGWAQSWKIIVGDFEEARTMFTELSDTIGGALGASAESRNNILTDAFTSPWDNLISKVEAAGVSVDDFKGALKEVARESGVPIDGLVMKYGTFEGSLKAGWLTADLFSKALTKLSGDTSGVTGATEDLTKKLTEFQDIVDRVWMGEFGNADDRVKALTEAGYEYAEVQELVNKCQNGYRLTLEDLSDTQLKSIGYTEEQIAEIRALAQEAETAGTSINNLIERLNKPSGRELMIESVKNALQALMVPLNAIGQAWEAVFPSAERAEVLYNFLEGLRDFTASLVMSGETAEDFKTVMQGLFTVLKLVATLTSGTLSIGFKVVNAILAAFNTNLLSVAAAVSKGVIEFEKFVNVNELLSKAIKYVVEGAKIAVDAIRNWINAFLEIPEVSSAIDKLNSNFSSVIQNFDKYLIDGKNRIADFIKEIRSMDSLTLEDVGRLIEKFKTSFSEYFSQFGGFAKDFGESLKNLVSVGKTKVIEFATNVSERFADIGESLGKLKDKFLEFVTFLKEKVDIDWGAIIGIAAGVTIIAFIRQLGKAMDSLSNISLSGLLGIDDALDSYADLNKAKSLREMATAIAILVGSIAVLTMLDQEKVWGSVGVLGALAGGLLAFVGILGVLEKFNLKGSLETTGLSILALATSMLIITKALQEFESLDLSTIAKGVTTLGVIALGLVGVMKLLGGKNAGNSLSASLFIISFASSVKILVSSLDDLEKANISGDTIGKLLGVIASLSLVMLACKNVKASSFVGVLGAIVSIKLFLGVLEDLAEYDISKITANMDSIIVVIGLFAAMMLSTRLAGNNALKAGASLIAMSAAIDLVVVAIKMLSGMNSADIDKAMDAITSIGLIFAALIATTTLAGDNAVKAGAMLVEMSAAMLILTGAIKILGTMDQVALWNAVGAVSVLELMFAVLIASTKKAKECKGTLIVLAATIGVLVAAIAGLAMLETDDLKNATASLTMVIGVFSLLVQSTKVAAGTKMKTAPLYAMLGVVAALSAVVAALSHFADPESAIATSGALSILLTSLSASMLILNKAKGVDAATVGKAALMGLVVGELAIVLGLMDGLGVEGSITTVTSLSILLASLTASMVVLSKTNGVSAGAVGAALLMGLVIGELAVILGVLDHFDVSPSIETAASLSLLLISLSGALAILSAIGPIATASFSAMGALAVLIAGLGAILAALGALNDYMDGKLEHFVETGIPILEKIGYGLGSFVTNIVSGGLVGLTSGLAQVGENLSAFMESLNPFLNDVTNIDPNATEGVKNLAETMLILTGADLLGAITKFFTGKSVDFAALGEQFKSFGEALVGYSQTVSGKIDASAVESSAAAGQVLVSLANNLPKSGGLIQEWFGTNMDLGMFGTQIKAFGLAIVEYSQTVAGNINEDAILSSANAGKALSDLANSLPSVGGKITEWFGGKMSLTAFGFQIKEFGKAIVEYSQIVAGNINEDAILSSANAGKALSDLANSLPSVGGKITEWFFGEKINLEVFATQIKAFGAAIVGYSRTVTGNVNEEAVLASVNAGKAISELANNLPSTGGKFAEWFGGQMSLFDFGTQLSTFGAKFLNYSNLMKQVSPDVVTATSSAATSISTLANNLPSYEWFDGKMKLGEFGEELVEFGGYFGKFYANISSVEAGALNGVITEMYRITTFITNLQGVDMNAVSGFKTAIAELGTVSIDGLVTSFTNGSVRVTEAVNMLLNGMNNAVVLAREPFAQAFVLLLNNAITTINQKQRDFDTAGGNLITKLIGGMKSKDAQVTSAVKSMLNSAISAVSSMYSRFESAGRNLVQGFANGIALATAIAERAARNMARDAIEAAEDELDERSPSKEGERIGRYFTIGTANGIGKLAYMTYEAGAGVAEQAKLGLSKSIANIADSINGEIDVQPTIRPVLDLTDVQTKTSRLNALFSRRQAVSISSEMNQSRSVPLQSNETATKSGNVYTFTQNNYSPKALSRVEIYRQTKNQFSAIERMAPS